MKRTIHIFKSFLIGVLGCLLLEGCVDGSVYENNRTVDPSGWQIGDSVEFVVDVNDTLSPMNFLFTLRHNGDYEYSNIYFFVNTVYPNSHYSRDTIEILLATKEGKWYGKGLGELKEVQVMLKNGIVFPMSGSYTFSFVQAMREEALVGVEDIGIRIEKMKVD